MNYTIRYDPRALQDLKTILDQLADIKPDLPRRFRSELALLLEELDEHPERWRPKILPIRRAQLKLSPKMLYYVDYRFLEEKGEIQIFQIIDQRANPNSWRKG